MTVRSKRGSVRVAVALSLALVVGACGSSSKSSSSTSSTSSSATSSSPTTSQATSGSSTPATTGSAPSGTTYAVGIGARLTGQSALTYVGSVAAAQAWESWVNSHGGISGHPVKVYIEDTASDAAKGLAAIQDLVQNKHVIAYIPDDPSTDPALVPYSKTAGIAVLSVYNPYPLWTTTPGWFGLGLTSVPYSNYALLQIAQQAGKKSMAAVVCSEVAACASADPVLKKNAPAYGISYEGVLTAAQTAPDYTPQCLALKAKGAQSLYLAMNTAATTRLASNCAAQGYSALLLPPLNAFGPGDANIPGATVYSDEAAVPWFADVPALQTFKAAMTAAGTYSKADVLSTYMWATLQVFAQAAATLGDSPTKASFMQAMYQLQNVTAGGLIPPVSFTAGQPSPVNKCYYVAAVVNGQFTMPQGTNYKCLS